MEVIRQAQFEALFDDRIRAYALAFEKLSPTALFFPRSDVRPSGPRPDPGALQSIQPGPALIDSAIPPEARHSESLHLGSNDCARMGGELSSWYFGTGGLLMTEDARDAYFALMEALRLAAGAEDKLAVPTVGEYGPGISQTSIISYRDHLANTCQVLGKLKDQQPVVAADLKSWRFGTTAGAVGDAERFKDFVLIQQLASRFRTALTEDIKSRGAPG
jgi:hypothetical protein